MSPLTVFTIVLDGRRFLPYHLESLNASGLDYHWIVVEGAAANTGSTSWCKLQKPRLSIDGTTEFLNDLRGHPRITVMQRDWWEGGKDQMTNAALSAVRKDCILLEADVDELFSAAQLETLVKMFDDDRERDAALFWCRYWCGPHILTVSKDNYGNRNNGEWLRAWRYRRGQRFLTHEPPRLSGCSGLVFSRDQTRELGLVFDHPAYAFADQVQYKEQFYGYQGLYKGWLALQENEKWPAKLRDFMAQAEDDVLVDNLGYYNRNCDWSQQRIADVEFFFPDREVAPHPVLSDPLWKPCQS